MVLATAGCLGSATEKPDPVVAEFPIEAPTWHRDMVWKYRVGTLDPAGGAVWTGIVEYQVIAPPQCDILGICIYEVSLMGPDGDVEAVVIKSTDLHRVEGPITVRAIPFPLARNATVVVHGFEYHVGGPVFVDVPAGRLWSVEVTSADRDYEYRDWYAPAARWSARTVYMDTRSDAAPEVTELVGFLEDIDAASVSVYRVGALRAMDDADAHRRALQEILEPTFAAAHEDAPDAVIDRVRADLVRLRLDHGSLFEPKKLRGAQADGLAAIAALESALWATDECVRSGLLCAEANAMLEDAGRRLAAVRMVLGASS